VRFLADESCDFSVVRALRAAGFDVLAISELSPRALDETVIDLAVRDDRVLLTEDKDFGQLVYASARPSAGVILLRFQATRGSSCPARFWISSVSGRIDWLAASRSYSRAAFECAARRQHRERKGRTHDVRLHDGRRPSWHQP